MPTYQYACKACEHQFEAVQSFSDASLTDCPECSGPLRKLFGSVGVIFKGSGFYRNDSRSGTSSKVGAAKGSTANGSDSNGSGSKGSTEKASSSSGSSDSSGSSSSKATTSVGSSTAKAS